MILVVGSGGNGQTYFMQFLNKNNINTNDCTDIDGLKHLSSPEKKLDKVTKCIFLYNSSLKSILSHIRRKWAFIQCKKLGNPYNLRKRQINHLATYSKLVKKHGKDLFGIKYQFNNWINTKTKFPILFLNFNDILDNRQILNKFIGKKLNYEHFKVRKRNNSSENNNIDNTIINIYNNLDKFISEKSNIYNSEKLKIETNTSYKIDKVPEVKVPEVKVPEVKVPEVKVPEVKVPEVKVNNNQ